MHACIRHENNNYADITYVFWLHVLRFFGPYLKYHTTEKEADSNEYAIYQLSMEKNGKYQLQNTLFIPNSLLFLFQVMPCAWHVRFEVLGP